MSADNDTELPPGTEIAGYVITGVAGRGGMGVVYRARQLDLDREVALKLVAGRLAGDPDFRQRFVRESRAAAAIDHPNVVPVFAAGESGGRLFLAMRLVDGEDLRTRVRTCGPLEPLAAARIIAQVGEALDAAHARGIVHRDVKPANVLLDGDHAYLTDFGLTKRSGADTSMTAGDRWVGTLGYIAPEQIRSGPIDARTDVYALGCLLVFMLTGESPYRRDSDEATLWAHLHDPPPGLSDRPDLPGAMAAVVARALAKDPAERFQSAGDLGTAALAAVGAGVAGPERVVGRGAAAPGGGSAEETLVGGGTAPTSVTPSPQRVRGAVSRRTLALLAAAIVAAVVVALLLLKGAGSSAPTTPATTPAPAAAKLTIVTGAPIKVDPRPNAIAFGDRSVWVLSAGAGSLIRIPAAGGRTRRVVVGGHPADVAWAFGSLWLVTSGNRLLLKIDGRSLKVTKSIALATGGTPVAIVAGAGRLWIAVRPPGATASIIAVDPATGTQTTLPPFGEEGINGIEFGAGRLWIANGRRPRISTVDPAPPFTRRSAAQISSIPLRVAYGAGSAWVTGRGDNSLAQVSTGLGRTLRFPTCLDPVGVAAAGANVWVACELSGQVQLRAATDPAHPVTAAVGLNPHAITADGQRAWVANLGDGTVTPLTATRR